MHTGYLLLLLRSSFLLHVLCHTAARDVHNGAATPSPSHPFHRHPALSGMNAAYHSQVTEAATLAVFTARGAHNGSAVPVPTFPPLFFTWLPLLF